MAKSTPRKEITLTIAMRVEGIDANWDDDTFPAYLYRKDKVYPYMEGEGFTIDIYQGCMAKRIYTAPKAKQLGVVYITGSGHGSSDTFAGYLNEPIFHVDSYSADELKDKIVHFLSCETAINLGKDFVKNGCRAFFRYDVVFTYVPSAHEVF